MSNKGGIICRPLLSLLKPHAQIGLDGIVMGLAGELAGIAEADAGGLANAEVQSRLDESGILGNASAFNRKALPAVESKACLRRHIAKAMGPAEHAARRKGRAFTQRELARGTQTQRCHRQIGA